MRLTRIAAATLAACILSTGLPVSAQAPGDPAVRTIRTLYAGFEAALKDGTGDARSRAAVIGGMLAETFDFPAMVRTAVGPKWKTFSPEQQGALTEAFGGFFTATYATRLAQAAGGTFTVKPSSTARGANRIVQTEVGNAGGDASEVDYLVGPEDRVQDVYLNGDVSEIAAMRGSFADALRSGGAEGLLAYLRDRTSGMLAAKPTP